MKQDPPQQLAQPALLIVFLRPLTFDFSYISFFLPGYRIFAAPRVKIRFLSKYK